MGNQQAKVSDIAWLAGFIDGEGCLTFNKNVVKNSLYFTPAFKLANTDFNTLEDVKNILDMIGVGYNICTRIPKNRKLKSSWTLTIQGFKRLPKLLSAIDPYLKTKGEQSTRIIAWIQLRSQRIYQPRRGGERRYRVPYSEQELQLIREVKNHNGKRSQFAN